jgi:interferon, gamma-inducible protein 30
MLDIMNITIVPYGNAKPPSGSHKAYTCQHGTDECLGNRWEQCALAHYPIATSAAFYICMEKAADNMLKEVQKCATQTGLDYATLQKCYGTDAKPSAESWALQAQAAAQTPSDHKYAPWILVNGVISPSDGDKLLAEVCGKYKGSKPAACAKYAKPARCMVD